MTRCFTCLGLGWGSGWGLGWGLGWGIGWGPDDALLGLAHERRRLALVRAHKADGADPLTVEPHALGVPG